MSSVEIEAWRETEAATNLGHPAQCPYRFEMTPERGSFFEVRLARARRKLSGPDRRRLIAGAAFFGVMFVVGLVENTLFFRDAFGVSARSTEQAFLWGAIPAFTMLLLYLPVPSVLDRFDPEPWWCLLLAFLWGAVVATGLSVRLLSWVPSGVEDLEFFRVVVLAPVVEELLKGTAVIGVSYFLRREFDGIVDGIIYAMFTALGFAAVENVAYYGRAALEGRDVYSQTFILRGLISPFGHPLYTAMIGVGFGLRRESARRSVRIAAPIAGTLLAIMLHSVWNYVPRLGADVFVVSLVFWAAWIVAFTLIVFALVIRKGRTIRRYLRDEVIIGNLNEAELAMITSAFGRLKSFFVKNGATRRRFIRIAARLALAKWHVARAARRSNKETFSMEFIGPLRSELRELRARL